MERPAGAQPDERRERLGGWRARRRRHVSPHRCARSQLGGRATAERSPRGTLPSRRNPTLTAHRSACDGIRGGGLPTSVRSSPTRRKGSVASTVADRASPVTLRRRRVGSFSSSSKTRIPSFYSLRVRVRGQTWL
jgi:hypothetical protein